MDFEIKHTETKRPKLTVTPTRMTIKYPIEFPDGKRVKFNFDKYGLVV